MTRIVSTVIETVVVEDRVSFSFAQLCRACGADAQRLASLVEEGLLRPQGSGPDDWLFDGHALARARAALRLGRDFELDAAATALVVELLEEIESLRATLRRAGIAPP